MPWISLFSEKWKKSACIHAHKTDADDADADDADADHHWSLIRRNSIISPQRRRASLF
ncbi:MAG: hypothetical protein HY040_09890 [Planctomycetes bacterium]|nr:hypothetical protein [Planctomycetota bacterium]